MTKIIAILTIAVLVALASASQNCGSTDLEIRQNLALKWVAAFKSINSTLFTSNPNGAPQYDPALIGGNIAYDPAIIDIKRVQLNGINYNLPIFALFGNITVLYGIPGAYQGVTSYSGAMDIHPDILPNGLPSCETGIVNHRLQISNLASASYQPGSLAIRRYTWHDTERAIDDILQLSVAGVAELYWRRNVPWTISSLADPNNGCTATATIQNNGAWGNTAAYVFAITNTGSKTITALNVAINIGSDTVNSQYNYNVATGAVSGFYQIAPGGTVGSSGFQLDGPSVPVVTSVTATCAVN